MLDRRRGGVGIPDGQRTEPGTSFKKVHALVPAEEFVLVYDDENGKRRYTIALKVGTRWYIHPNAEDWARDLRPVNPDGWLGRQVEQMFAKSGGPTEPHVDTVDVLGASKG